MNEIRLFKFSVFVRVVLILLQVIFNRSVPDHNADAFRLPHETEAGVANSASSFLLDGFTRWDSQYFLHVTLYGYTHENTLAFFPLFPILLREASGFLARVFPFDLGPFHCTLVAGVLLNALLASLAAVFLYKLTSVVCQSELLAFTSALLFCINPASIFFSALYSESLFALLTFFGLWALETDKLFLAVLALALSAAARSNGTLAAGFLVYAFLKRYTNSEGASRHNPMAARVIWGYFMLVKIFICLCVFVLPFAAYQVYCYLLFCTSSLTEKEVPEVVADFLTRNDLKIPSEPSKWCFWNVPLSYSYVQSRYWDVGFLHYYTVKQIPNFVLAAPVFLMALFSCTKYFARNRRELWHMGLLERSSYSTCDIYNSTKCFPYFLHICLSTIFCTLFIHIQVLTRMLCSSSPVLYWFAATTILPKDDRVRFKLLKEHSHRNWLLDSLQFTKKVFLKSSIQGRIIFSYFLAYFFIGTFLHVNFFPWT